MGVTGLWRLIEPSGTLVPLQTLNDKILAVDVSIWLHQAIKGFQTAQGGTVPNSHLLGIYHRICKLLFYGIKPVIIFDGSVPHLKQQTIFQRANKRTQTLSDAEQIHSKLVSALLKHTAISNILSDESKTTLTVKPVKEQSENIYQLLPSNLDSTQSSEDESTSVESSPTKYWDLHTIDEKSEHFKALPVDVRHDILTDLKETRKQSSWGKIHEIPKQSDDFSVFQMKRLLKRYSVQVSLEEVEKEMGGRSLSLAELESLLKDQGVMLDDVSVAKRIASDENKRYLLIKDLKKAMDEAKRQQELLDIINEEEEESSGTVENEKEIPQIVKSIETSQKCDLEYENDLKKAIELSLQDVPSTSRQTNVVVKPKLFELSFLQDFDKEDFHTSSESDEDLSTNKNVNKLLASAKNYMVEYSGLTPNEITKIMSGELKRSPTKLHISKDPCTENITSSIMQPSNRTNKITNDSVEQSQIDSTTDKSISPQSVLENVTCEQQNKMSNLDPKEVKPSSNTQVVGESSSEITSTSQCDYKSEDRKLVVKTPFTEESSITPSKVVSKNIKDNLPDSNENLKVKDPINSGTNDMIEIEEVHKSEEGNESDSSTDFVEVNEDTSSSKQETKNIFEIVVKPEETLEDDLFGDIFNAQKLDDIVPIKETPKINKPNLSKIRDIIKTHDVNSNSNANEKENIVEEKNNESSKIIEEFSKPTKSVQIEEKVTSPILREQLKEIQQELQLENAEMIKEQLTKERMANSLSEQIIQETQDLLRLFGIPFIIAPMEAEAQCAFLEIIDLTDGTITDDSDIWLFGGKTVYKNFFSQQKQVLEFRAEKIQEHYKLAREQMILLALLVGSDYTLGLQGVGPVTALEVLGAFPTPTPTNKIGNTYNYQQLISGLIDFRKWLNGEKSFGMGRHGLKSKLKNVSVNDTFPNLEVVRAYLEPNIDLSKEAFSWGKPNIDGLIEYAKRKFGWSPEKSKGILKPVLKSMNPEVQKSIKHYFKTKHKIEGHDVENKMSKRVKKAVKQIEHGVNNKPEEDTNKKVVKKAPRKRRKPIKDAVDVSNCGLSSDEDVKVLQNTVKQSKTKLNEIQKEVVSELTGIKKVPSVASLHKKEIIPQKQKDKVDALRNKIKAIETFRKSKKGPGFVKSRKQQVRVPKADAELSESSSSD